MKRFKFVKIFLCGLILMLSIFLIVIIRGDCTKQKCIDMRQFLFKWPGFRSLIVESEQAKSNAKAQRLTFDQPDFSFLRYAILNQTDLNPSHARTYLKYYHKAEEFFPEIPEIYSLIGYCHAQRSEWDKAAEAYTKAIQLNPAYFWFYYNLGIVYLQQKDYLNAAKNEYAAMQTKREDVMQVLSQANVYHQIFWPSRNFNNYRVVDSLNLAYPQALEILFYALYKTDQYTNIINLSKQAIDAKYEHDGLYTYLAGYASYRLNNLNNALQYFKESVTLNPELENFYYDKASEEDIEKYFILTNVKVLMF